MPILCEKCGAENKDDAQFCQRCGAKLAQYKEHQQTQPKRSFIGTRSFAIVVVLLAIIGMVMVLPLSKGGATASGGPGAASTTVAPATTTIAPQNVMPTTFNPAYGVTYYGNVEYNQSMTIWGDVAATGNITIDKGVVIVTNGSSLLAGGTFANFGTIDTGDVGNYAALGAKGRSYPDSYGGSGGSGGGGGGYATGGSSAVAPKLNTLLIQQWYSGGVRNYLTGAGGGGGCPTHAYAGAGGSTKAPGGAYMDSSIACTGTGGAGGAGAYGIYVQANKIVAGTINANGQAGTRGSPDAGGSGGGGVILLAYGTGGYVPGAYNTGGGNAVADGGAGGNGLVLNYSYASGLPPVYLHATPSANKTVNTTGPVPFPKIMPLLAADQGTEASTQSGANVWVLPNSMETGIVPIAFIGYKPGIKVNFTSSSQLGAFVNTTGQEYANQCVTGYSESCIVAYALPQRQANFTITAVGGNSTASANIELR